MASSTELYKFGAAVAGGYHQLLAVWTGGAGETYLAGTGVQIGLGRTTGVLAQVKAVANAVVTVSNAYCPVWSVSSGGTITVKLLGSANGGGAMTEMTNGASLTGVKIHVSALAQ